ncbi:terminase large subunit domain-containing protein [Halorubellus litoreus]|uniref:Terminase large subunit domain-containing protein n=1 Tax=Halorubellus litoreus TaxID=755308 RepID=A0ABD5VJX2_9EURY
MTREIAERLSEETGASVAALLERWDGHPELLAEDLFRVKSQESHKIEDLELFWPYQPQLLHAYFYSDGKILNVYKGRRIGVSFIFMLALLIDGIQTPGAFFPIVSTRKSSSESRVNDIRKLIQEAKVEIPVQKDNKGEIVLWNGATFRAYTGNPEGARGDDSAKAVFVDEMAFLENQEDTMRAFMPFVSLGDAKMIQVSTPKVANDLFMTTHRRGNTRGLDEEGHPVPICIKQPSFKNPDAIDIETSLFKQDVEPVRPDMDIEAVEQERAQDPQGFAQEYLCRPISDEYRFFSVASIQAAMEAGGKEVFGPSVSPQYGGTMVAGVDFGMTDDETVISVFEHTGKKRHLRYQEVLDRRALELSGIENPDRANPNHIAKRLKQLKAQLGVEHFVMDATSFGKSFKTIIEDAIGYGVHGFDFNDRDGVKQMMGDLNYGLRNGLVTLHDDDRMFDQLSSIVKVQKEDHQKPKFTGKEQSKDGKDDIAMSVMLGAYPVMLDTSRSTQMHAKEREVESFGEGVTPSAARSRAGEAYRPEETHPVAFGATNVKRGNRKTYSARYRR